MPRSTGLYRSEVVVRHIRLLRRFVQAALVSLSFTVSALAAGGDLDPTFKPGAGASDIIFDMARQPDGKVVIVGGFNSFDNTPRKYIARLNADGSLDANFDPVANSTVYTVALQPDGKILIGGAFSAVGGIARGGIARLKSDGSVDESFVPTGHVNSIVFGLAAQPDGKALVVGAFTTVNDVPRNRVARLNADGTLDTSFNPGAGANNGINAVALQPDGKVIVGGFFNSFNGIARGGIARLNTDGSLDTGFDPGTGAGAQNQSVFAIALQPDGRVVVGGDFGSFNGVSRNGIVRLHSNGTVDFTFNPGSGADSYAVRRVVVQGGKVILGGQFFTFNGVERKFVARLNFNGTLDTTFNPGSRLSGTVSALVVQPDGSVIVGGTFTAFGATQINRIARLQPAPGAISFAATDASVNEGAGAATLILTRTGGTDGAAVAKVAIADVSAGAADYVAAGRLDPTFNVGTGVNGLIYDAVVQPDDKVIVAGSFSNAGGLTRFTVARINANGSADTTFAPDVQGTIESLALQRDGKVLIGGSINSVGGVVRKSIARLFPDGTLDTSFDAGSGTNLDVAGIAVQPDGKVIIGGRFTQVNGVAREYVARLNANGSLDTTFNPTLKADWVNAVALQPDGKILLGGLNLNNPASRYAGLVRLNTDGSLDPTFNVSGANSVYNLRLLEDGKVLIVGAFQTVGGVARSRVARLNADGSLDTSFDPGAGSGVAPDGNNNAVASLDVQPDGKIIVAGPFTFFDGVPRMSVARLNKDGSLDTSFDPGAGATLLGSSPGVNVVRLQSDGSVIIVGGFTSVDGTPRNRIAALVGDMFAAWEDGDGSGKAVSLPIVDDLLDEPDETLSLTLAPLSGQAVAGAIPAATLTIVDNDVSPSITSLPPPAVITKGVFFSHTFVATGHPASTFSVTAGSLPPGLLLSASGVLFGAPSAAGVFNNITVTAANGIAPNVSQTFSFRINTAPIGHSNNYTVDEDTTLAVGAPGVLGNDIDEDGDPLTSVLVTSATRGVLTFGSDGSFLYTPGANFFGVDSFSYRASDGNANSSLATVQITVAGVNDSPFNIVPGAQNLAENTPLVFSAANGNRISVADIDAGNGTIRVTLSATNGTLTLRNVAGIVYSEGDGTADALLTFSGRLTAINAALDGMSFNPAPNFSGEAELQITSNDLGNTGTGGQITAGNRIALTVHEGGQLQFSAAAYSVAENAGVAAITVSRTGGSAGATTVNYFVADGTASAGSDYGALAGTLSFASGELTRTFNVNITNDPASEQDETVNLTLSGVTGSGSLGAPTSAVLTIVNDDAPFFIFGANAYQIDEGADRATVTVLRTGDTSIAATALVETVDNPAAVRCDVVTGVAYARCDYSTTIETLTWAAGDAQPKTVAVPLIDDAHSEGAETFQLRVSGAAGGAANMSTLTILDNETAASANPISGSPFFVRMQYLDFLSREPEANEPWTGVLARCADVNNTDPNSPSAACDRILVSQSFFGSPEFHLKGYYAYLFYRVAFARRPEYAEIIPDMRSLAGRTPAEVYARRSALAEGFAQRPEFTGSYAQMSNAQYVDALLGRYGLQQITTEDPANPEGEAQLTLTRQHLIDGLANATLTRAQALRAIVQSSEVEAVEYQGAFVAMQYYGYLRRTPEQAGYESWLRVIRQDSKNIRIMIDGFMNSVEYRLRFGQP
jgi:uncharacterized delta-60 repeat protein